MRRALIILAAILSTPAVVQAQDWDGWYSGVFAGFSRVHGENDRWPSLPIAGRIDGSLLIGSPSGQNPGMTWQTFTVGSPSYAEFGALVGYSRQFDRLIVGGEASISSSLVSPNNGWGRAYSLTSDFLGKGYSFGISEGALSSGLSAEFVGRVGTQIHDKIALFISAGVSVDDRGLVGSLNRVGPGRSTFSWADPWLPPTYTADSGPQATLHVNARSAPHISPIIGASAEFLIGGGWKLRSEYQVKFTAAQTVTVDVVRATSDPIALPVVSDTVLMHVNSYSTHTARLGMIKSF